MLFIHGACAPSTYCGFYWVPLLDNGLESLLLAIIIAIEANYKG
jgi:hypothetical protein